MFSYFSTLDHVAMGQHHPRSWQIRRSTNINSSSPRNKSLWRGCFLCVERDQRSSLFWPISWCNANSQSLPKFMCCLVWDIFWLISKALGTTPKLQHSDFRQVRGWRSNCNSWWRLECRSNGRDFSPTETLGYGVFSPDQLRFGPVQFQHQLPGKVPEGLEGSGGYRRLWCGCWS